MDPQRAARIPSLENNAARRDILDRARDYPYELEQNSYLLLGRRVLRLDYFDREEVGRSRVLFDHMVLTLQELVDRLGIEPTGLSGPRTALLAFGSNASPWQLRRKFSTTRNAILPVLQAWLLDFDIVYSAHFSLYGAIPANIRSSPGTKVSAFVTYFTDQQLKRLHESESNNYDLAELFDVDLQIEWIGQVSSIKCYLSRHGCLQRDGTAVRLEAFPAMRPRYPASTERDLLQYMATMYLAGGTTAQFIHKVVEDPEYRYDLTKQLRAEALDIDWPSHRILKEL
jgi:hypothetical protein